MSEQDIPDIHLRVLYDFEYIAKGNRKITIQEGEKLFLIKKTNSDWWQVIRSSSERPFYVPAAYVEEYSRSPESRKEISRCRSFKKIEERKLKSSAPLPVIKRSIPSSSSYEEEVVCDKVENMGERKRSCSTEKERFNSEKQKTSKGESSEHSKQFEKGNKENISTSNKEQVNHILLDKRKSWAVEELVAELSKMRSERNSPCHQEQNAQHITKENVISLGPYVVDNSDRLSPDSITCSSKYTLSLERDKTDSETEGNTQYKEQSQEKTGSIGETYSKVCLNPPKASKNVDKASRKLSDSLERLAQQIQFEPSETSSSRSTPGKLSHSLDESKISPFTNTSGDSGTKMESMFSRMRNKLSYSSSFKTKKEMQQGLKRGGGNSVLSTSWENALSETEFKKTKDERRSLEEKRSFRTSAKVMLDPIKGEARFLDGQLKTSRSGSELDGLGQENASQKAMHSWNLVQQKVFGDKLKSVCVSGSESEENLDESIGQDEDSVSGVSDDILMFQNATKVSYSDFSDGAMSDDLLVEPLEDRKEKDIHGKLQKRKVSLTRRNRVESYGSRNYTSPPSPSPGDKPVRVLNEDWEEYKTSHGRTYYYNHCTRDKSWKPPRRQHKLSTEDGSIENLRSSSSSPLVEVNGSSGSNYIPVPDGWRESYDGDSGQPCYINDATGAKVSSFSRFI